MTDDQNISNHGPEGEQNNASQYASEGYQNTQSREYYEDDSPSLQEEAPEVAGSQNRKILLALVVGVVALFIVYMFFSGGSEPLPENAPPPEEEVIAPPPSDATNMANPANAPEILPAPVAPEAPTTSISLTGDTSMEPPAPPVPEIPAPPPDMPAPPEAAIPVVDAEAAAAEAQKREQRRRAGMLVMNGNATTSSDTADQTSKAANNSANADPNAKFAENQPSETEQVVARRVGKMENMVVQGKIVEAVLETAINSDLPGTIRAIVSRDTYSESGKNILLPKGSRLIGTYNTAILTGQRRVYVVWSRVIRPDGIDVMIDSPGIDQIGRSGVEGIVDNKYFEIYSAAILSSLVTIGTAAAGEAVTGNDQVTQSQNAIGGIQTTGSPSALAVQQAVTDLGQATRGVTSALVDMRPTIMLDQGTRINVFVNKDLIFPTELFKNTQIIQ